MHYPAMLNLRNKKCAVIGGGNVAFRKCKALLECGANIKVISPEFQKEFDDLNPEHISLIKDVYKAQYIEDCFLVIAAAGEKEVNLRIYSYCSEKNILVNVVDEIELCTFTAPAYFRRGDLTIAVSTGGKSPALAKKIKEEIAGNYGEEYSEYVETMGLIRAEILKKGYSPEERLRILKQLLLLSHKELSDYHKKTSFPPNGK